MDDPMDDDEVDDGQDKGRPVVIKTEDEMLDGSANRQPILSKPGSTGGGAALLAGSVKRLGSVREGGPDLSMVISFVRSLSIGSHDHMY